MGDGIPTGQNCWLKLWLYVYVYANGHCLTFPFVFLIVFSMLKCAQLLSLHGIVKFAGEQEDCLSFTAFVDKFGRGGVLITNIRANIMAGTWDPRRTLCTAEGIDFYELVRSTTANVHQLTFSQIWNENGKASNLARFAFLLGKIKLEYYVKTYMLKQYKKK